MIGIELRQTAYLFVSERNQCEANRILCIVMGQIQAVILQIQTDPMWFTSLSCVVWKGLMAGGGLYTYLIYTGVINVAV